VGEEAEVSSQESVGHRIVRAMFVVIFFQIFWKFGGLIIAVLVGSVFRAGVESDAYLFVSETVVFLLQTLCLQVFIPVVVPIFKEQLGEQSERAAWRFGSTVLSLTVVVLALVTAGGMLFAPRITGLIAEGFNERQAAFTTRLMRLMFPGVFAICLATVTYALLNSYNIFGYAAAGDALQKMLWAGIFMVASMTGLALSKSKMLDVLAVAFLLGAAATLLTHLVGLRSKLKFLRPGLPGLSRARIGKELGILAAHVTALAGGLWVCRLSMPRELSQRDLRALLALQQVVLVVVVAAYLLLLWWRARGRRAPMAKFAALSVPLLFGILFAKYRDVLTNLFASFTGTGVFSDLKYARKIGEAPNTLIIAALSIAILPHLCELATQRRWHTFANVMTRTIRTIVIFFVPLAALTYVLRRPIIQLFFDRGNWSDYHLYRAGDALGLYILALPFFAIENPIQQSFFAMQRMWTVTLIGFLGTGFHILFLFVGIEWLGFGYFHVVALVYVAARAFKNIILIAVMRYHVKILPWRETIVFLAKALTVAFCVILAAYFTYQPLKRTLSLEPYRRREVMIDTFNVDLHGWESDNVDELRIVSKDDKVLQEALAGVLKDGESPVAGENALLARYRRSPRRAAGLRRDLGAFKLVGRLKLALDVAAGQPTDLALELVTRERESVRHGPIHVAPGKREHIEVELRDFRQAPAEPVEIVVANLDESGPPQPPGDKADAPPEPVLSRTDWLRDVVGLWIRDVTPVEKVATKPTTLALDNLALIEYDERRTVLDDFEAAASNWQFLDKGTEAPPVADTGERADRPELALHLLPRTEPTTLVRGLETYELQGCDRLTFKARSSAPCTVTIHLVARGLIISRVRPRRRANVAIEPSTRRKGYVVPISAFLDVKRRDFGFIAALDVEVPRNVDLWLDNVAFVREPRGPRVGAIAAMYELMKLVHVIVPSLAAFVVFVVLLFVFRVEEGKRSWEWLRDKALKKVLAKIRRRPPADPEPAGGEGLG